MIINVYQRYYEANFEINGSVRRGASVMLISDSEAGKIKYTAAVTFMPYENPQDFRVPYDAYYSKILYEGTGRRSKKKEQAYIETLQEMIDELAESVNGKIFWDKPLTKARLG